MDKISSEYVEAVLGTIQSEIEALQSETKLFSDEMRYEYER